MAPLVVGVFFFSAKKGLKFGEIRFLKFGVGVHGGGCID